MNSSSSLGPSTRFSSRLVPTGRRAGLRSTSVLIVGPFLGPVVQLSLPFVGGPPPKQRWRPGNDASGAAVEQQRQHGGRAGPAQHRRRHRHRPQRGRRVDDEQHRPARPPRRRTGPASRWSRQNAASSDELSSRRSGGAAGPAASPGPAARPTARWSATEPVSSRQAAGGQVDHHLGARTATTVRHWLSSRTQASSTSGGCRRVPARTSRATVSRHSGASAKTRVRPDVVRLVGAGSGPGRRTLRRATSCAARGGAPGRAAGRSPSRPSPADGRPGERLRQRRPGRPSSGRTARRPGRRATPAAAPSGSARRGRRRA